MLIPNTVKVGAFVWQIKFVEMFEDKNTYGECEKTTLCIKIKRGMPDDVTAETLLHELIHAVNYGYEEEVVHTTSVLLFTTFRENPALRDVLFP